MCERDELHTGGRCSAGGEQPHPEPGNDEVLHQIQAVGLVRDVRHQPAETAQCAHDLLIGGVAGVHRPRPVAVPANVSAESPRSDCADPAGTPAPATCRLARLGVRRRPALPVRRTGRPSSRPAGPPPRLRQHQRRRHPRALPVLGPGGHDNYFDELAEVLRAGRGHPDPAAVADLRRRYDIEQLIALRAQG